MKISVVNIFFGARARGWQIILEKLEPIVRLDLQSRVMPPSFRESKAEKKYVLLCHSRGEKVIQ